ncbi:hypothetical protein ACIBTV_06990 [Micromonospora sp. NPDC049366]|uniref:hypothetical protein n=1 Tax=Micromonospora sp. NPDC049366 TaxID=3364271 RepID=UPI0037880EE0
MTWRRITLVVAVVLALVAVGGWRWWHNHPPYGPEALAVTSSLTFVSPQEARAVLGDNVPAPVPNEGDQLVLGRVSWEAPPEPFDGGYFAIFLIDKRTNIKVGNFAVSSPRPEAISAGSAGVENRIAERYPWLKGAGDIKDGDTWWSHGSRLAVSDAEASPLTFVAQIPYVKRPGLAAARTATAPIALSDLLLALAYLGPDGQVYWAQRLQG